MLVNKEDMAEFRILYGALVSMSDTHLIISLRLKHKVDKYVRYVNILNVLFAKISIQFAFTSN